MHGVEEIDCDREDWTYDTRRVKMSRDILYRDIRNVGKLEK